MIDETRLGRIRWRCRRGMLENDLILTRFLDALLDLTDDRLWDVLSGRAEPEPRLAAFVARLRAA